MVHHPRLIIIHVSYYGYSLLAKSIKLSPRRLDNTFVICLLCNLCSGYTMLPM